MTITKKQKKNKALRRVFPAYCKLLSNYSEGEVSPTLQTCSASTGSLRSKLRKELRRPEAGAILPLPPAAGGAAPPPAPPPPPPPPPPRHRGGGGGGPPPMVSLDAPSPSRWRPWTPCLHHHINFGGGIHSNKGGRIVTHEVLKSEWLL
jgi:hypothetical protein